jgi:hypothetical protein
MSNLFSYVLSFILFIPTLLFGFDLYLLQVNTSELEAYATRVILAASDRGVTENLIAEVDKDGYQLICLEGCKNPEIGQTQKIVITKNYNPLFISKEELTLKAERSYLIGYY